MEKEINKVKKQILIIIIFSIIIFGLGIVLENYIDDQLVSMFIGFSGSIIGGIATMLAVYSTLTYDRGQRENEKEEIEKENLNEIRNKKNKIKLILKNEMEMALRKIENDALIHIYVNLIHTENIFEINGVIENINSEDTYIIDSRFKELVYDFLMLSENNVEIEKAKLLLNFYNKYLNTINVSESIKDDIKYLILTNNFLKEDINLVQRDIINPILRAKESEGCGKTRFDTTKFNELVIEFNQGKIHFNDDINNLINFLDK